MKKTKKLYTGEIRKLSLKKLEPKPEALLNLAYESTVVNKDALFYKNILGVVISVDYNTKLATRDEAEYYLRNSFKVNPGLAHLDSCLYQESDVKFSHEVTKGELKQLIKTKKAERKLEKKGNK